ncbi:uncharacterized protein BX663DRAFT_528151 [Cokeromyces recurvatus]|uniref:uncharacterized protein n=1 Tax=Cokeromyces recurvatus TaxID=90255 RepID=UPI00221F2ED8|nr:uncharacterized protein BX663DRAFT_528151 [Cokeromyces recurvatus]KAI7897494.1 hypothetical protein BX663DRAFT_528151 [Cokeromyces recurvatus]
MTPSSTLYEKALRYFLLKKYKLAATTCDKALCALIENDPLEFNVWTLYLNITFTLLSTKSRSSLNSENTITITETCCSIWKKLIDNNPLQVDPRLISAYLIMVIKLNEYKVARDSIEEWFASLPNDDTKEYEHIVELYIRCILPALEDYESARVFLEYNTVLTNKKKEELLKDIEQEQQKNILERQKREENEEEKRRKAIEERERKEKELEEEEKNIQRRQENKDLRSSNETPQMPASSTSSHKSTINKKTTTSLLQKWLSQQQTSGVVVIIVIFMIIALLRGQRTRLTFVLKKIWDTVKMGTKITYM